MAREALPEGYRDAGRVCKGLKSSIDGEGPGVEDLFTLVREGGDSEWVILQSKTPPTFNTSSAYIAVRRRSEMVTQPQAPTMLMVGGSSFREVAGPVCETTRGAFEPLGRFGRLIEDPSASLSFDTDAWGRKSIESMG
jgi:hypothetical protein